MKKRRKQKKKKKKKKRFLPPRRESDEEEKNFKVKFLATVRRGFIAQHAQSAVVGAAIKKKKSRPFIYYYLSGLPNITGVDVVDISNAATVSNTLKKTHTHPPTTRSDKKMDDGNKKKTIESAAKVKKTSCSSKKKTNKKQTKCRFFPLWNSFRNAYLVLPSFTDFYVVLFSCTQFKLAISILTQFY